MGHEDPAEPPLHVEPGILALHDAAPSVELLEGALVAGAEYPELLGAGMEVDEAVGVHPVPVGVDDVLVLHVRVTGVLV